MRTACPTNLCSVAPIQRRSVRHIVRNTSGAAQAPAERSNAFGLKASNKQESQVWSQEIPRAHVI